MSIDLRREIFRHTDATAAVELITEDAVLKQLKKLKKNRSPGVDGFTVEHLISVFLGGSRNVPDCQGKVRRGVPAVFSLIILLGLVSEEIDFFVLESLAMKLCEYTRNTPIRRNPVSKF